MSDIQGRLVAEVTRRASCTPATAREALAKCGWDADAACRFVVAGAPRGGGVRGMDDVRGAPVDPDKQTYYTGGEKSGTAILFPDRGSNGSAIASRLFGKDSMEPSSIQRSFDGSAQRLGNTLDTVPLSSKTTMAQSPNKPMQTRHISFWKTGFTVDNAPVLRRYDDPANNSFLEDIEKGLVPLELQTSDDRGMVDFVLEDHRKSDYQPPKPSAPKVTSFSGTGNVLGSSATTTTQPETPSSAPVQIPPQTTPADVIVDPSKPTTTVQVRLIDGKRLTLKLNQDHTIADLYHMVGTNGSATGSYTLALGVPPFKPLQSMTSTLQEAGVINAVVLQKSS
ncbi:NSFL1 cofactor p47 [Pelomyxa schiedti]|nr:NSFL1 cofactor p47 [Pelomyxa schiedti]